MCMFSNKVSWLLFILQKHSSDTVGLLFCLCFVVRFFFIVIKKLCSFVSYCLIFWDYPTSERFKIWHPQRYGPCREDYRPTNIQEAPVFFPQHLNTAKTWTFLKTCCPRPMYIYQRIVLSKSCNEIFDRHFVSTVISFLCTKSCYA